MIYYAESYGRRRRTPAEWLADTALMWGCVILIGAGVAAAVVPIWL